MKFRAKLSKGLKGLKGSERDECIATNRRGRPPCLPEQRTADTQRSPLLRGDWGLQSSHSVAAAPQRGANPPFATEGEGSGVVATLIVRADTGVCPYGWCLIIFHFSLFSFHSALCAVPVACLIPSWNFCCSCWASALLGFSFSAFSKFWSTSM